MAYLWKQIFIPTTTPATGDLYTNPFFKIADNGEIIVQTEVISDVTDATGPYSLTGYGFVYDNFGNQALPQFTIASATIPDSSSLTAFEGSNHYGLSLPSTDGGVAFYVSSDSTHWIVNRDVITGSENGITGQTTDQVDATIPIGDTIIGMQTLQRSDGTYGVSYVVQDTNGDRNRFWQGYNADNSPATASPVSLTSGFIAAVDGTPAGAVAPGGGAYVRVAEQVNVSGFHYLKFIDFKLDGTPNGVIGGGSGTFNLNFGNTSVTDITQVRFQQFSSAMGGAFVVVDSELHTDGNYHVIFRFDDSGTVTPTNFTLSTTPQTVRVAKNENDGSTIIGWGDVDGTGATLALFDSTGAQVAIAGGNGDGTFSIDDGNFDQLRVLGDGRVAVGFHKSIDANTTEDVIDIVDLRTGSVNLDGSAFAANGDYNYAGTQFADTFLGSDTSNNHYDGAAGADIFKFDAGATSGNQSHEIVDYDQSSGSYNAGEGDQVDVSAIVQTAFQGGQQVSDLVKVETQGGNAKLFVDADGTANGVNWTPIAQLDGIQAGDGVNVIVDSSVPAGTNITVNPGNLSSDFNGDGTSDILFRNDSTGDAGFYTTTNLGSSPVYTDVGTSSTAYNVVGVGDFNGDGTSDILFRDNATGDTGFYTISNGINTGWNDVGGSSPDYSVVGVGDFNGDGTSDILFRDDSTGDTGFYTTIDIGNPPAWNHISGSSTAYTVVGVGDFNSDGTSDILFRDNASGDTGFYAISNGANTGWNDVGGSSTLYNVVGVGDFNGDGTSDILFRDNSSGDTGFYTTTDIGNPPTWNHISGSSTDYTVVGTGDYNNDGTSDILFRDNATGDTGFYAISNGVNTSWNDVGGSSTLYHVVG